MYGGQNRRPWIVASFAFIVSAASAGAFAGAILGLAGATVDDDLLRGFAFMLGFTIVVVAMLELVGRRVPLPQRDRETRRTWLGRTPWLWGVLNGSVLGLGFTTRIGLWLWYVVPATAFVSADAMAGAVVFGLYGFTRSAGAWLIVVRSDRSDRRPESYLRRITRSFQLVRRAMLVPLLVIGAALTWSSWPA